MVSAHGHRFPPCPCQTRVRGGSWVGSPVCTVEGGPGPGHTLAASSAGLLSPVARSREPPSRWGLSCRARVRVFTLCQTLRGLEKKGSGWRHSAPAPCPAGETPEPYRGGRSLPASWSPRWLLGQDCGDASCFSASDPKGGKRGRSGVGRSHGDRRGRIAVRDKTKLVWGGRMRTGGISLSCPLVRKPAPLTRAEPWSGALRSLRDRSLSF